MRKLLKWLVPLVVLTVVALIAMGHTTYHWGICRAYHLPIRYDKLFGPAVEESDKLVVAWGISVCHGKTDVYTIHFTVSGHEQVQEVIRHLDFQSVATVNSMYESCMCCGSVAMEWYSGDEMLALTTLHHGENIRWRGFATARLPGYKVGYGDGPLTEESANWLLTWLDSNGIPGPKQGAERRRLESASMGDSEH